MWRTAVETPAVQEAIAGRTNYRQDTVRMFGLPESGLAESLRDADSRVEGFDRLEITTCLRRGELEIVTRYEPEAQPVYAELMAVLRERHGRHIFSEDGARVDDQVAALLAGRRIATAESCTAGLVAARLTDIPGSSAYVAGGVVAYANEAKTGMLDVDPALIEANGAVSEPVAEAMAEGALRRFGADTAVATTGIAGPGGGTEDKPVGTVCFSVMLADGPTLTRTLLLPGNRSDIRERSTTVAMHLLRRSPARRERSCSSSGLKPAGDLILVLGHGESGQPILMHLVVDGHSPLVTLTCGELERGDGGGERDGDRVPSGCTDWCSGLDDAVLGVSHPHAVAVDQAQRGSGTTCRVLPTRLRRR